MRKYSLTKELVGTRWLKDGLLIDSRGGLHRGFSFDPIEQGVFEEEHDGPLAKGFFAKVGDLLSRLPNGFEGHLLFNRKRYASGIVTKVLAFEAVKDEKARSALADLLCDLAVTADPLESVEWADLVGSFLGAVERFERLPDVIWEKRALKAEDRSIRALSLTELPQATWEGCFQALYEVQADIIFSLRLSVPSREKVRKRLETRRRISHALSLTTAQEIRNIESSSALSSAEEALERILVGKETMLDVSLGIIISGTDEETDSLAKELSGIASGLANGGLFLEGIGTLPVLKSHIPGNQALEIRTLPVLSANLSHLMPLQLDYSRKNEPSSLRLVSRCGEVSTINLFSKDNLNYNAMICGASGSGKSFLMNSIIDASCDDYLGMKICIFDIGGSYRKVVKARGGTTRSVTCQDAKSLLTNFLRATPVYSGGLFRPILETLCGSGSHISHSHRCALDDLLSNLSGRPLKITELVKAASSRREAYYQEIAHWLRPFISLDASGGFTFVLEDLASAVCAFDFKDLDQDLILQRTTILILSEALWRGLMNGTYQRTLVVFDEVWKFFKGSQDFIEEMYRTFRKYGAGITSITQNVSDYGSDEFAKMLFTNSFTKIFLQGGAERAFLKDELGFTPSDCSRAMSVASKKPVYSEFFVASQGISQILRLYPEAGFYSLANTENISS